MVPRPVRAGAQSLRARKLRPKGLPTVSPALTDRAASPRIPKGLTATHHDELPFSPASSCTWEHLQKLYFEVWAYPKSASLRQSVGAGKPAHGPFA